MLIQTAERLHQDFPPAQLVLVAAQAQERRTSARLRRRHGYAGFLKGAAGLFQQRCVQRLVGILRLDLQGRVRLKHIRCGVQGAQQHDRQHEQIAAKRMGVWRPLLAGLRQAQQVGADHIN